MVFFKDMVNETIGPWLPRLHVVIIGPGLGRDPTVLEGVGHLVDLCRAAAKPLVVDADGLWLATLRPDLFKVSSNRPFDKWDLLVSIVSTNLTYLYYVGCVSFNCFGVETSTYHFLTSYI